MLDFKTFYYDIVDKFNRLCWIVGYMFLIKKEFKIDLQIVMQIAISDMNLYYPDYTPQEAINNEIRGSLIE